MARTYIADLLARELTEDQLQMAAGGGTECGPTGTYDLDKSVCRSDGTDCIDNTGLP